MSDEIALRPFRDADAPTIAAACADPEIIRWTRIPEGYSVEHARAFIRYAKGRAVEGDEFVFGMVDASDTVVGAVGATVDTREPYRAEIGYWVASGARGRGVGSQGVGLMLAWLRSETAVVRVSALVYPGNGPSERLLGRLGFAREGLLSAVVDQRGVLRDAQVFTTLIRPRGNWRGR